MTGTAGSTAARLTIRAARYRPMARPRGGHRRRDARSGVPPAQVRPGCGSRLARGIGIRRARLRERDRAGGRHAGAQLPHRVRRMAGAKLAEAHGNTRRGEWLPSWRPAVPAGSESATVRPRRAGRRSVFAHARRRTRTRLRYSPPKRASVPARKRIDSPAGAGAFLETERGPDRAGQSSLRLAAMAMNPPTMATMPTP